MLVEENPRDIFEGTDSPLVIKAQDVKAKLFQEGATEEKKFVLAQETLEHNRIAQSPYLP